MSGQDAIPLHFAKPPHAALLFDVDTGEALGSYKPFQRLPIASLTKIMTALLVTERAGPNERVMITRDALRYGGTGIGLLPRGKRIRLETLLNGLLIVSGNDTAIALADHVSGSQRAFVAQMNRRACSSACAARTTCPPTASSPRTCLALATWQFSRAWPCATGASRASSGGAACRCRSRSRAGDWCCSATTR